MSPFLFSTTMWIRLLLLGLLLLPLRADPAPVSTLAGRISWARLKTSSDTWDRHARSDPKLLSFVRNSTSLNIDLTWHAADVESLRQMCIYPFLFSEGIDRIHDEKGLANLREYLNRHGFIFVDSCINTGVNPDPDVFLEQQMTTFKSILPDATLAPIPAGSGIFHNCFDLQEGLPHTYMNNVYRPNWARHGLYGVTANHRLVGIISLSGLQCGWDGMKPDREHIKDCMEMMVNIYVYALTH